MVTTQTRKAYSETLEILKNLPQIYTKKIPTQVIDAFESEKLEDYKPIINSKKPIDKENLQKETLEVIAMLNYNYWCQDEETKARLYKMYSENEEKKQEELEQKYNVENIFEKRKEKLENDENNQNENTTKMIEYKESFFRKIVNKIKSFFYKK